MFFLEKWDDLPEYMKNEKVKLYYDKLYKKKVSIFFKRLFDIIVSFFMIVLLLPIFLVLAIWIKIDSKGPVFYRQERITTNGKVFKIFKFRTMIQDADKRGSLVTTQNDDRITNVGKKIRKLRIDELPQIFNVFLGDMSFVGTRPEVEKYVKEYSNEMLATLLMPAGITCTASVKYKDEDKVIDSHIRQGKNIDEVYVEDILPEKMRYNFEYLKKFNILEDINVCFDTVIGVLK